MKIEELESFGSHDPESKQQIRKRQEFEKLKGLLKGKDCIIEKMTEDGNCLYRAVARQIYGDQELYQRVRDETVDYIILHRGYFASFETDIDVRLSKQLVNRSWGGNLEIEAISELYNVGILVWELSKKGELITPFDNTPLAASKGLKNLYLSRHRGIHFNSVIFKNQKLPLGGNKELRSGMRDARGSFFDSLSKESYISSIAFADI